MATLEKDMAHFKTLAKLQPPRVFRAVFIIVLLGLLATLAFLIYVPWVQTTSGRGVASRILVDGNIAAGLSSDGDNQIQGSPSGAAVIEQLSAGQVIEVEAAHDISINGFTVFGHFVMGRIF